MLAVELIGAVTAFLTMISLQDIGRFREYIVISRLEAWENIQFVLNT